MESKLSHIGIFVTYLMLKFEWLTGWNSFRWKINQTAAFHRPVKKKLWCVITPSHTIEKPMPKFSHVQAINAHIQQWWTRTHTHTQYLRLDLMQTKDLTKHWQTIISYNITNHILVNNKNLIPIRTFPTFSEPSRDENFLSLNTFESLVINFRGFCVIIFL